MEQAINYKWSAVSNHWTSCIFFCASRLRIHKRFRLLSRKCVFHRLFFPRLRTRITMHLCWSRAGCIALPWELPPSLLSALPGTEICKHLNMSLQCFIIPVIKLNVKTQMWMGSGFSGWCYFRGEIPFTTSTLLYFVGQWRKDDDDCTVLCI